MTFFIYNKTLLTYKYKTQFLFKNFKLNLVGTINKTRI